MSLDLVDRHDRARFDCPSALKNSVAASRRRISPMTSSMSPATFRFAISHSDRCLEHLVRTAAACDHVAARCRIAICLFKKKPGPTNLDGIGLRCDEPNLAALMRARPLGTRRMARTKHSRYGFSLSGRILLDPWSSGSA